MVVAGDFAVRQNDAHGFLLRLRSGWNFGDALDEHIALAVVIEVVCIHDY
jgi:hypothetical protein